MKNKVNRNSQYNESNNHENWTLDHYIKFEKICGAEMRKYGYKLAKRNGHDR